MQMIFESAIHFSYLFFFPEFNLEENMKHHDVPLPVFVSVCGVIFSRHRKPFRFKLFL